MCRLPDNSIEEKKKKNRKETYSVWSAVPHDTWIKQETEDIVDASAAYPKVGMTQQP